MHDVAVVGGGAVGLSVALHAAQRGHGVVLLEKETAPGQHQSTRNSGVIHAGYNLKPGSQKARFCVEGARRMKEFCRSHGVAVHEGGIVVVAQREDERATLRTLLACGQANGVEVRLLDSGALPAVEPHAAGIEALHAPGGASVDAAGYVAALQAECAAAGVEVRCGWQARGITAQPGHATIRGARGDVAARVVVNCAGVHADRLAGPLAEGMRVVPFRGYYARLGPAAAAHVRSHIYAAPDPRFPFLGVHLSRRTDGSVVAGPGAMLAGGREAYRFWQASPRDAWHMLAWGGFWRMLAGAGVLAQVPREVRRSLMLRAIWKDARALVPTLPRDGLAAGVSGIRAQLVDPQGRLVDDIVVREGERQVHVLNAVSPGLTSSLPFGEHVAKLALRHL